MTDNGTAIVHLKPWRQIVEEVEAQNVARRAAERARAEIEQLSAEDRKTNHLLNYIMGRTATKPTP